MNHTEAQKLIDLYYKGECQCSKKLIESLEWGMKQWNEASRQSQRANLLQQKITSIKNTIDKATAI